MTKDTLIARRDDLKQQLTQIQANVNAVAGAVQLLDQLIAEEEVASAPSEPAEKE